MTSDDTPQNNASRPDDQNRSSDEPGSTYQFLFVIGLAVGFAIGGTLIGGPVGVGIGLVAGGIIGKGLQFLVGSVRSE